MKLTLREKGALVDELRKVYGICKDNGYTPSEAFIKLGKVLKSEVQQGAAEYDEAEDLYQNQTREEIETWLEAVEANIENEGRGGTGYSDKEKVFIEDMRGRFHEREDMSRPLTGKQLRWLKALYDKS